MHGLIQFKDVSTLLILLNAALGSQYPGFKCLKLWLLSVQGSVNCMHVSYNLAQAAMEDSNYFGPLLHRF